MNGFDSQYPYKKPVRIDFESFGSKVPPHSPEAEMAVLGSIMLDETAIDEVFDYITPESFYSEANRKIYSAMLEMSKNRVAIDIVTLSEELIKRKNLEDIGGTAYLSDINRKTPSAANVEHYAMIVQEHYAKRVVISTTGKLLSSAYDESTDALEELETAENAITELTQNLSRADATTDIKTISITTFNALSEGRIVSKQCFTGFEDIDKTTGGYIGGRLYIVAGRPSSGKTAFAISQANKLRHQKKRSLFYSLEMSKEELVNRLLVQDTGIESWKFLYSKMDTHELKKIASIIDEYDDYIRINDRPQTLGSLRADIRKETRKYEIDVIWVDYLQQIQLSLKNASRENVITAVAEGLKGIAKETKIPVVALSPINRNADIRNDKEPKLSDLRESGGIEYAADVVWFTHRPYQCLTGEQKKPRADEQIETDALILQDKNRYGKLVRVESYFEKNKGQFYSPYQPKLLFPHQPPVAFFNEPREVEDDGDDIPF